MGLPVLGIRSAERGGEAGESLRQLGGGPLVPDVLGNLGVRAHIDDGGGGAAQGKFGGGACVPGGGQGDLRFRGCRREDHRRRLGRALRDGGLRPRPGGGRRL